MKRLGTGIPRARAPLFPTILAGMTLLFVTLGACSREPAAGPISTIDTLGQTGTQPGQFFYPRAIDAAADSLWIIDKTARVQRLDPRTGDPIAGFRMPQFALGKPTGVTVAPFSDDEGLACYVPDTHYHRVAIYPLPEDQLGDDATPLATFGEYGTSDGQFIYPTDVAVLADDQARAQRIYVTEYGGNDRVSVFDPSGRFLFSFGEFGAPEDGAVRFNRPQSIAIDPERREIIVADACNHRLGRFTIDGELIAWVGSPGADLGQLNYPYGLCVLEGGRALVAEFGNNRVQQLDMQTGESLGLYGESGRGPGQLLSPWGITVLDGRAYALDSGNDRVLVFRAPGRRVASGGGV